MTLKQENVSRHISAIEDLNSKRNFQKQCFESPLFSCNTLQFSLEIDFFLKLERIKKCLNYIPEFKHNV